MDVSENLIHDIQNTDNQVNSKRSIMLETIADFNNKAIHLGYIPDVHLSAISREEHIAILGNDASDSISPFHSFEARQDRHGNIFIALKLACSAFIRAFKGYRNGRKSID